MSNVERLTPFIGPDTLRKLTQLMKSHFDSYIKKDVGYEDIDGSSYVQSIRNFGNEILFENRKLLMDKPSLKNIIIDDDMSFYFNIEYSELVNTYDQQYMIIALLKKDVFINNYTYTLRFDNCDDEYILRAKSSSDPNVYRGLFIHTTTPPTLIVNDGETETEISLIANDDSEYDTDYYFYNNATTESFIDSYEDGTLTTIPITNKMCDLPFIWMCFNKFHLYPTIDFINNSDYNNHKLLSVGTDGFGVSFLYPYIYGEDNLPSIDPSLTGEWYLKIKSKHDDFTNQLHQNEYCQISSISFINTDDITQTPKYEKTITYDDEFVKIHISPYVNWLFRKPTSDDYDFDGLTYKNPYYGYIKLDTFLNNIDINKILIGAFILKFDKNYEHQFVDKCNDATVGIHIDNSTEYIENGMIEKNGVSHYMGEFDGLPNHLKIQLDRKFNRNHIDIYSIKNITNNPNEKITNKKVCGLIIDSGVPQNDYKEMIGSMEPSILYDIGNYQFITEETYTSPINILSEITYVNDNEFSLSSLPGQSNNPKFIYHGNNEFSLGMIDFDPYVEIGRIYYISNDSINYINNSNNNKPARTLARICDIPTSFIQISNIHNQSPSILPDWNSNKDLLYNHTDGNFKTSDLISIWNINGKRLIKYDNTIVFPYNIDIIDSLSNDNKEMINLNLTYDLSTPSEATNYQFKIFNEIEGYNVGDIFKFNIGGVYFTGEIISNNDDLDISIHNNSDAYNINISNIGSKISVYNTTTIDGEGVGLQVSLTIDDWDDIQPTNGEYLSDLYAYKFDEYNHIWLYQYDGNEFIKKIQLTGEIVIDNFYDKEFNRDKRTNVDVFLYNLLNISKIKTNDSQSKIVEPFTTDIDISTELNYDDRSDKLVNYNLQNSYFMIDEYAYIQDYYCAIRYSDLYFNDSNINKLILPKFHNVNLSHYVNNICQLLFDNDEQPQMYYYDINMNKKYSYYNYTNNHKKIININDITFNDYMQDKIIYDSGLGKLKENVYHYNDLKQSSSYDEYVNELHNMTREALINKITLLFDNAYPLQFENTGYEYTKEMLIDYLLLNYYQNPIYKRNDTKLMRLKNDTVLRKVSTPNGYKYEAIGENPTGGMKQFIDVLNPNVILNDKNYECNILFVFKLKKQDTIVSLNDFRLYDEEDNDISNYSLLIYDNKKYIHQNNEWIELIKEVNINE